MKKKNKTRVASNGKSFIKVTCEGSRWVTLDELIPMQGELKTLSEEDFKKGTNSMVKYGFSFPFFVWIKGGKIMCLDGHQRDRILKKHKKDGKRLPAKFPAVGIQAKNEKEAKEKILLLSTQYGRYTMDSMYQFMEESNIKFDDMDDVVSSMQFDWNKFGIGYEKDGDFTNLTAWPDAAFASSTAPISELKPHPLNYRTHPDDQIEHLMASIKDNGIFRNIVVARDNTILAGHGVAEAARRLGMMEVPITRLDLEANDPRALKILAGDNEISRGAQVDDRALADMLKSIMEKNDLIGSGFDKMQLSALAFITRSEILSKDVAAHWAGMPDYDPGNTAFILSIQFKTEEDRRRFLEQNAMSRFRRYSNGKILSTWWPDDEDSDISSVKYDDASGAGDES